LALVIGHPVTEPLLYFMPIPAKLLLPFSSPSKNGQLENKMKKKFLNKTSEI
jgi:hypothetical protein